MRLHLALLTGLCLLTGCGASSAAGSPPTLAPPTLAPTTPPPALRAQIVAALAATWNGYKSDFIQGDGRVIDHARHGVTTSEGQSYALLRAVWMDDRSTFDSVWTWTRDNLEVRRHDALFGYLWGRHRNGTWSMLSTNTATDGDEDTALALVFAAGRWHDTAYLAAARRIISSIWHREVTVVAGRPIVTAGNWATSAPAIQVDPSYLAPYAYRIFARVDRRHHWMAAVDSAYVLLAACSGARLGEARSAGLPPNWCAVRRNLTVSRAHELHADWFGYDAFRVEWRIALDYLWFRDPRDLAYLRSQSFLRDNWLNRHALAGQYRHDGAPVSVLQDPTTYGGDLGVFVPTQPRAAEAIVKQKLLPDLHTAGDVAYWDQRFNYYEQNWVWFGLALYADALPRLTISSDTSPTPTVAP